MKDFDAFCVVFGRLVRIMSVSQHVSFQRFCKTTGALTFGHVIGCQQCPGYDSDVGVEVMMMVLEPQARFPSQ